MRHVGNFDIGNGETIEVHEGGPVGSAVKESLDQEAVNAFAEEIVKQAKERDLFCNTVTEQDGIIKSIRVYPNGPGGNVMFVRVSVWKLIYSIRIGKDKSNKTALTITQMFEALDKVYKRPLEFKDLNPGGSLTPEDAAQFREGPGPH